MVRYFAAVEDATNRAKRKLENSVRIFVPTIAALIGALSFGTDAGAALSHSARHPPVLQQSAADSAYADLMRSTLGRAGMDAAAVTRLEQFIRDYASYRDLDQVYSRLISVLGNVAPERQDAAATEFLSRFRDSRFRAAAYDVKFGLLEARQDSAGIASLGRYVLDTEKRPDVLRIAAEHDRSHAIALLDRAMAQRRKSADANEGPTLLDLRWSYASALRGAGRNKEGIEGAFKVIEETTSALQDAEADPTPKSTAEAEYLRVALQGRYAALVQWCTDPALREVGLKYVKRLQATSKPGDEGVADRMAGELYARLGADDLALDALVRAYGYRMETATRDAITAVATKVGRQPNECFERADRLRIASAKRAYDFDLKTDAGKRLKLADVKAKVVLLAFFFPT